MSYLFTKGGCSKCDWVKGQIDLGALDGLQVMALDSENPEALAMLAYYECVALAEKKLPIFVTDGGAVITGAVPIKKYLKALAPVSAS
jgi:hypothetical protein